MATLVLGGVALSAGVSRAQTGETFTADLPGGLTMEFVRVPAGTFQMGLDEPAGSDWHTCSYTSATCNQPVHAVTLDYDLFVGVTEVTRGQWRAIMGDDTYSDGEDDWAMAYTSWEDSNAFTDALNELGQGVYRLPSEAEWEYAARAGTTTRFHFDEGEDCQPTGGEACDVLSQYAWWGPNNPGHPETVGLLEPNPWGLYDMYGNVYEWCLDSETSSYEGAPTDGSPWILLDDDWKVLRGSWRGYSDARRFASAFRAAHQNWYHFRHSCCGLRAVREVDPERLRLVTTRIPPAVVCEPFSYQLRAVAGAEPVEYSILEGELPLGLELDPDTGEISGTSRRIVRSVISVRVADAAGDPDLKDFLVKSIPTELLHCATVDSNYRCQGAGPHYEWDSPEIDCDTYDPDDYVAPPPAGAAGGEAAAEASGEGGSDDGGCGCSAAGSATDRNTWILFAFLLPWRRRRTRR